MAKFELVKSQEVGDRMFPKNACKQPDQETVKARGKIDVLFGGDKIWMGLKGKGRKAPIEAGLPRTNESLILVYTYRAKPCQTPLLKLTDFTLPLIDLLPAGPQVHFRLGSCYCGAVPWRCTGAGLARERFGASCGIADGGARQCVRGAGVRTARLDRMV